MMRPVTRVFTANDREKNDSTVGRYQAGIGVAISDAKLGIFARAVIDITRGTLASS